MYTHLIRTLGGDVIKSKQVERQWAPFYSLSFFASVQKTVFSFFAAKINEYERDSQQFCFLFDSTNRCDDDDERKQV